MPPKTFELTIKAETLHARKDELRIITEKFKQWAETGYFDYDFEQFLQRRAEMHMRHSLELQKELQAYIEKVEGEGNDT